MVSSSLLLLLLFWYCCIFNRWIGVNLLFVGIIVLVVVEVDVVVVAVDGLFERKGNLMACNTVVVDVVVLMNDNLVNGSIATPLVKAWTEWRQHHHRSKHTIDSVRRRFIIIIIVYQSENVIVC